MSWWSFVLIYAGVAGASMAVLYLVRWLRPSTTVDSRSNLVVEDRDPLTDEISALREEVRDVRGVRAMFLQAMGEQVERQERLIGEVADLRSMVAETTDRLAKTQSEFAELRQLPDIREMRRVAELELLRELFTAGNGDI